MSILDAVYRSNCETRRRFIYAAVAVLTFALPSAVLG